MSVRVRQTKMITPLHHYLIFASCLLQLRPPVKTNSFQKTVPDLAIIYTDIMDKLSS